MSSLTTKRLPTTDYMLHSYNTTREDGAQPHRQSNGQRAPTSQPRTYLNGSNTSYPVAEHSTTSHSIIHEEGLLGHSQASFLSPSMSALNPSESYILSEPADFDLEEWLTPEYSSDNNLTEQSTHTSPCHTGQEEASISTKAAHCKNVSDPASMHGAQFHDLSSSLLNSRGDTAETGQQFRTAFASQLLSPQLATPSPSVPSSKRQSIHKRANTVQAVTMQSSPARTKRTLDATTPEQYGVADPVFLDTDLYVPSMAQQHIQRTASPIVTISHYGRGDSPAREYFPAARSPSRRSTLSVPRNDCYGFGVEEVDDGQNIMPFTPSDNFAAVDESTQRTGLAPMQRTDDTVPSVEDIEEERQLNEKNAGVQDWLSRSETGSNAGDDMDRGTSARRRGRNNSAKADMTVASTTLNSTSIGYGTNVFNRDILDHEHSEDEHSTDGSALSSDIETQDNAPSPKSHISAREQSLPLHESISLEENIPPEEQEPLPRQFFRRTPWEDPARFPGILTNQGQPETSNAAAWKFEQQVKEFETASRAATWGTRRRLSESEVRSIVDGSSVRHLSLSQKSRQRGNSIINRARGLIPRRSNSNIKRTTESVTATEEAGAAAPPHRGSVGSIKPIQRMPSFGRSKTPNLSTGSAIVAMANPLAAVGRGAAMSPEAVVPSSPTNLVRSRSKSDLPKPSAKSTPGLSDLMSTIGGPPMPTLASPRREPSLPIATPIIKHDTVVDDSEDSDAEELDINPNTHVCMDNIESTIEGFKRHAQQLNPRLELHLHSRIGQEQIRRYKKLVENKVKHTRAVASGSCASAGYCFDQGGDAILLLARASGKGPDAEGAHFQITQPGEDEHIDESNLPDGVMTPAAFPPGVPVPPVKRLPAEFECPLCFKVKKFYKPSDWTKHVHEDLQPFSCTFEMCAEPKSFKRKADWVRHENERHRHLESWECSMDNCTHVCYRKDNFVQHLVREHKLSEPRTRSRGNSNTLRTNGRQLTARDEEENETWQLVESCRKETALKAKDEPCKFCGAVHNTWKKLSVHVGKHMEQIAMPVLELVKRREVWPDTIISPVEQSYQQPTLVMPMTQPLSSSMKQHDSVSPYTASRTSFYQGSSAAHSPALVQSNLQMPYGPTYYNPGGYPNGTVNAMPSNTLSHIQSTPQAVAYGTYNNMHAQQQFMPTHGTTAATYPPPHLVRMRHNPGPAITIARSQPLDTGYGGLYVEAGQAFHDGEQQQQQQQQQVFHSPIEAPSFPNHYFPDTPVGTARMQKMVQTQPHLMQGPTPHLGPGNYGYDAQDFGSTGQSHLHYE